jgi:hypothetical protein
VVFPLYSKAAKEMVGMGIEDTASTTMKQSREKGSKTKPGKAVAKADRNHGVAGTRRIED